MNISPTSCAILDQAYHIAFRDTCAYPNYFWQRSGKRKNKRKRKMRERDREWHGVQREIDQTVRGRSGACSGVWLFSFASVYVFEATRLRLMKLVQTQREAVRRGNTVRNVCQTQSLIFTISTEVKRCNMDLEGAGTIKDTL